MEVEPRVYNIVGMYDESRAIYPMDVYDAGTAASMVVHDEDYIADNTRARREPPPAMIRDWKHGTRGL